MSNLSFVVGCDASAGGNSAIEAGFARKVTFNFSFAEKLFVVVDVAEEFPFLVTEIWPRSLWSTNLNEMR